MFIVKYSEYYNMYDVYKNCLHFVHSDKKIIFKQKFIFGMQIQFLL